MVKDGYPIALKIPSESKFEWLTTTMTDELIILNVAKTKVNKRVWSTITVLKPTEYINLGLYFLGHLDSDLILECMLQFCPPLKSETDVLAKKFENLITPPPKPVMPEFKIVVMDPLQAVNTPMEEGELKQTPPRDETAPSTEENVMVLTPHDDSDMKMNPAVVDIY